MKSYPSIPREVIDMKIYAFDKLDGSNIRAEWSPKQGLYKFGTRTRLLGVDEPIFGEAHELIKSGFEAQLSDFFKKERAEGGVAYFEFYGPNSFAGQHEVEPHKCVLIDVELKKRGFVAPNDFIKEFSEKMDTAPCLYHGNPNQSFIESVKNGSLPGMSAEGVVCKAPPERKWQRPLMFKVKTDAWITKVKSLYKDPIILDKLL